MWAEVCPPQVRCLPWCPVFKEARKRVQEATEVGGTDQSTKGGGSITIPPKTSKPRDF